MGKASSNKKVARAASTGGGRTARGRTPWLWYGGLTAIMAMGILLVVSSRNSLNTAVAHPSLTDHWHAAYGIFLCNEFAPGLNDTQGDRFGIHSHADGLVHIHPKSNSVTGKNATLGKFFTEVGVSASETSIRVPGRDALKNGAKCDGKKGKVQTRVWDSKTDTSPETLSGDPRDVKLKNGELITVAFVPEGADIPMPPSANSIDAPSDLAQPEQAPPASETVTPTVVAPPATPTTAAP